MQKLHSVRSMATPENQTTRSVDTKARELTMLASTKAVDSFGTIILPEAFRGSMDQYMRNPVILKNHDRRGDVVGKTLSWTITDRGLEKRVKFAPTKAGVDLFSLYAEGYMRSWSVGGNVPRAAMVTALSPQNQLVQLPDYAWQALRSKAAQAVYTDFILLETSAVTIGANPDALTKAAADGLLSAATARQMYDEAVRCMPDAWISRERAKVTASVTRTSLRGGDLNPVQKFMWEALCHRFKLFKS